MKKLLTLLLGAAMTASFAGCTTTNANDQASSKGETASGEKKEITFLTYNLSIASQKDAVQELIDTFNAQSDTVQVTGVQTDVASLQTKVQSDYVAGNTFDVVQVGLNSVDYYVENYALSAFEDIAGQEAYDQHMEGFAEKAQTLGTYTDGKTYVLPYTFSTPMLYYNKDLFEKAGLDPEQPPKTWEEVKTYGVALKDSGTEGIQITATGDGTDWLIQAMIYSNGGEVLSEDKKTILFGEQPAVDAISVWQDLVLSGAHSNYTDTEAMEAFMAGNQGMLVVSAAMESGLISSAEAGGWELGAAGLPSFGDKEAVPTNSGSGLCIMSQDEEKAKAAWEFIQFVTSEEGYTIITSKMGYLPLRPAIIDDEKYLKSWAEEHPFVRTNLEQLERLHKWVGFPGLNSGQIATTLNQAVTECIFSDKDVEAVMKQAQSEAQDLLPN